MNIRKTIALFAGGSVLLALAYAVAQAACIGCQPIGVNLRCGLGGFRCTVSSLATPTGIATFVTNNPTTFPTFNVVAATRGGDAGAFGGGGAAPASTSLQPLAFQGTGTSPTLGAVNWQFDVSRSVENTTITANQTGTDFPATLHIRFHIRGTIAAYPGVTFQSVTPLDVTGTVNSFDPLRNETLRLAAPVQLRDASNPQGLTLTINALTLQLNG